MSDYRNPETLREHNAPNNKSLEDDFTYVNTNQVDTRNKRDPESLDSLHNQENIYQNSANMMQPNDNALASNQRQESNQINDAVQPKKSRKEGENASKDNGDENDEVENNILEFSTEVRNLDTEERLQIERKEETSPKSFARVLYIVFQHYWELMLWIIFSIMVLEYYKGDINNFKNLALALASANALKVVLTFVAYLITRKKDPEMNITYFWNGLSALSFMVLYLGGFLFFNGNVGNLYYFAIHHIVIHLIIIIGTYAAITIYLDEHLYFFAESIQILFIAIKLGDPNLLSSWNITTIFYFIVYLSKLVIGGLAIIMSIVLLIIAIASRKFNRKTRKRFMNIASMGYNICLLSVITFLIFLGFRNLLNDGVVTPQKTSHPNLNKLLFSAAIALLIFCIIYWIIHLTIFILKLNAPQKDGDMNHIYQLRLFTYAKEMRFVIKKLHDTYFPDKRRNYQTANEPIGLNENTQSCVLCNRKPSEIIIKPCKHSGYCKTCMIDYLKANNVCPVCNIEIDSLVVFYYDEERNDYFSKKAIKLTGADNK